ncbi:hypothetical protein [Achromobacter xylosoxidans]|uniref:hypothetical protein n=1 Tax=Alcaligenes xylosoxydans xylosoxydans TaxID=85698 RepID=UPI00131EAA9D|nr:hypothetical protein [Achromobacter xylosoxidans]
MDETTRNAQSVTTATAAKIVGVGYEGLRSYLKRGLLGSSGLMPPFVGRDVEAPDLSSARAKWRRFGPVDLCLMRLAKLLMDAGLPFGAANGIASDPDVRRQFQGRRVPAGMILSWGPHSDFIVFGKEDLAHLPDRLADLKQTQAVYTVIRLAPIWEEVHAQMSAIAAAPAGIGAN